MDSALLLKLARCCIEEEFGVMCDKTLFSSKELDRLGASFVTLTKDGNLRGCIGSLVATRALREDICKNAKLAAFSDPRFPPLLREELDSISIEVSLLSEPLEVLFESKSDLKSKIVPHKHGVIIKKGVYQATFLPQVWEQLPEFETFFAHLCAKAGMRGDCIDGELKVFTYEVEIFSS